MTSDEMADRIVQDPLFLLACEAYNEARHDDPYEPESTFVWMLADGINALLARLATAEVANEAAYQAGYNSGVDAQAGLDAARLATAERLRQVAEEDADRLAERLIEIRDAYVFAIERDITPFRDLPHIYADEGLRLHGAALAQRAATDSGEDA